MEEAGKDSDDLLFTSELRPDVAGLVLYLTTTLVEMFTTAPVKRVIKVRDFTIMRHWHANVNHLRALVEGVAEHPTLRALSSEPAAPERHSSACDLRVQRAFAGVCVSLNTHDLSVGLFVRGLINLKAQLMKAEALAAASGRDAAVLLEARLPQNGAGDVDSAARYDLHTYTLAAQVHWATEGARLAIARIVGARAVPATVDAKSFLDLYQRIDATIADLQRIALADIEAGLGRAIVVEHRRGSVSADGSRFLLAYAIPHFFYHVTTAYDILRSEGVPLTMGDFLGDWGAPSARTWTATLTGHTIS